MEDPNRTECHCTCHEPYETFSKMELVSDGTSYWCSPCWGAYPCENG